MSTDTPLEQTELWSYLDEQLSYPITLSTVRDQIGAVTLLAPESDASETIATVIEHVDDERFVTSEELYETIVSRLPDAYIGRKYYDDRGSNPAGTGGEDESL